MWGPQGPQGMNHPVEKSGVSALIALEVIRPSLGWLREATPPHLFVRCREVMEPEVFQSLSTIVETFPVARAARMLAMNMITILRIHTGHDVLGATADDLGEVDNWRPYTPAPKTGPGCINGPALSPPLLPTFVAAAEEQKRWAAVIFRFAAAIPEGQEFGFERAHDRRVTRRSCYSDGAARPSVIDLATDQVLRLHHIEEVAFWSWATIEVFRHSGVRLEELLELTHLSIRNLHHADR
jgi:hypothetical protein